MNSTFMGYINGVEYSDPTQYHEALRKALEAGDRISASMSFSTDDEPVEKPEQGEKEDTQHEQYMFPRFDLDTLTGISSVDSQRIEAYKQELNDRLVGLEDVVESYKRALNDLRNHTTLKHDAEDFTSRVLEHLKDLDSARQVTQTSIKTCTENKSKFITDNNYLHGQIRKLSKKVEDNDEGIEKEDTKISICNSALEVLKLEHQYYSRLYDAWYNAGKDEQPDTRTKQTEQTKRNAFEEFEDWLNYIFG